MRLTQWIQTYGRWAAFLILLAAAYFIASIVYRAAPTSTFVLVLAAMIFIVFHYGRAIKNFDLHALDNWARNRMSMVGVHEWHTPYHAASRFCDPKVVRERNDAAAQMNSIMMEFIKERSPVPDMPINYSAYETARTKHEQYNTVLAGQLLEKLIAGDIIAKGSVRQDGITDNTERIIPSFNWNDMKLDILRSEASGGGLHYVSILIGKKSDPEPPSA